MKQYIRMSLIHEKNAQLNEFHLNLLKQTWLQLWDIFQK